MLYQVQKMTGIVHKTYHLNGTQMKSVQNHHLCQTHLTCQDTSQDKAFLMEPFMLDFQMGNTDFNRVYRFDLDVLPICPSTPTPVCTSTPIPKGKKKENSKI